MSGLETRSWSQRGNRGSGKGFARTEIFHACPFRLFRRLRTRFPPFVLRRPADAQTSSPTGFFRAGSPQKPHGRAKPSHVACPVFLNAPIKDRAMIGGRSSALSSSSPAFPLGSIPFRLHEGEGGMDEKPMREPSGHGSEPLRRGERGSNGSEAPRWGDERVSRPFLPRLHSRSGDASLTSGLTL